MRKLLTLLLSALLLNPTALAGVGSQQAKYSGGTTNAPPVDATGFLDATKEDALVFTYKGGKNGSIGKFSGGSTTIAYREITRLMYGEQKHLRVGQTIALSALAGVGGLLLLLSKSRTHFVTIEFKDEKGEPQVVNYELGKDAVRPVMSALELRTGKKFDIEAGPASVTH